MRPLCLTLICLAACSGPTAKIETEEQYDSFASVSPILESVRVETESAPSLALFREIDRMAARLDMLKLQQTDPGALTDVEDPELQRRTLLRQLAAFDLRVMEFEAEVDASAKKGLLEIYGYAAYGVCEKKSGVCLYRRQELKIPLRIDPSAPKIQ